MSDTQFSLADLFGDDTLSFTPAKKAEKKPEKAAVAKKAVGAQKSVVKLPAHVISEYETVLITAEMVGVSGEEDIELDEFKKYLSTLHADWAPALIALDFDEDNTIYVYPSKNQKNKVEGDTAIDPEARICRGGVELAIAEIAEEPDADAVKAAWGKLYPEFKGADYFYDAEAKVIVPMFGPEKATFDLPLKVKFFGGQEYDLSEAAFDDEKGEEPDAEVAEEAEDEAESEGEDVGKKTVSSERLCKWLAGDKKGLKIGVKRTKDVDGKEILLAFATKDYALMQAAPKKEETYPTSATVSLFYTKFQITAEDFGGKKKITGKDLINYLRNVKGCIEYTEDFSVIKFDKKENLIKVAPGQYAKKGADFFYQTVRLRRN